MSFTSEKLTALEVQQKEIEEKLYLLREQIEAEKQALMYSKLMKDHGLTEEQQKEFCGAVKNVMKPVQADSVGFCTLTVENEEPTYNPENPGLVYSISINCEYSYENVRGLIYDVTVKTKNACLTKLLNVMLKQESECAEDEMIEERTYWFHDGHYNRIKFTEFYYSV